MTEPAAVDGETAHPPTTGGDPTPSPAGQGSAPTATGPGRVLISIYGLFALAATARSTVQILTDFEEAPLAFLLSGLAGLVYIAATVALARAEPWARRLAVAACSIELVGVLVVGAISLARPEDFPRATVWSEFGSGYGYVPLVLPFVGLWWLYRTRRSAAAGH